MMIFLFFLKILFIYSTERDSKKGNTGRRVGEGEADFPQSGEMDVGLDSRTLGS